MTFSKENSCQVCRIRKSTRATLIKDTKPPGSTGSDIKVPGEFLWTCGCCNNYLNKFPLSKRKELAVKRNRKYARRSA